MKKLLSGRIKNQAEHYNQTVEHYNQTVSYMRKLCTWFRYTTKRNDFPGEVLTMDNKACLRKTLHRDL